MANIGDENIKRLETLYKNSHKWLMAAAFNITKDKDVAEELVSELYLYLSEKPNPDIWYSDSFNLMYLHSFLKTRNLNKIKYNKRYSDFDEVIYDEVDSEYDIEKDLEIQRRYDRVIEEFKLLERNPKLWAAAKITEMYLLDEEMTLEGLANKIRISKSTAFLNVKKIKTYLKTKIK
jgi:DNA-directed RNA polymerase specialized sigma24 family protein